ncbi:MAG: hypothetical protein CM1200mP28_05780 [Deltaproteobacteria bacterium]|nr:MAG: hypothetical protein CM1200mP28_05780 [Deltaproteobacteria bacterium]
MHSQLQGLRTEINGRLSANINKVNELGKKVAELNRQINTFEDGQRIANDMRDARIRQLKSFLNLWM